MDTVRQPRTSHLILGQFLIRICISIEPQKLCFTCFSAPRCSVGQANSVPVALSASQPRRGWDGVPGIWQPQEKEPWFGNSNPGVHLLLLNTKHWGSAQQSHHCPLSCPPVRNNRTQPDPLLLPSKEKGIFWGGFFIFCSNERILLHLSLLCHCSRG